MRQQYIPNVITFLRILLVWPLGMAILVGDYTLALVLFVTAGLSDAVDGFLAKRFGWETRLGAMLDPVADKLLMLCSYLMLGWQHHLPWWLVAVVVGRDMVILAGAAAFRLLVGRIDMAPTYISKANTFFQIALVAGVLLGLCCFPLPPAGRDGLVYVVLVTSVWSGLDYVYEWGRSAWRRDLR